MPSSRSASPLRVPLVAKLVGANVVVVGILAAAWLIAGHSFTWLAAGAVAVAFGAHLALVLVALRPIRNLEKVATRVWQGDAAARVGRSSVADRGVLRVGSMFNLLLDDLEADRARMRALAADVIVAGDRERAALARELHDSTAQQLAALLFHLSSAARDVTDPDVADRLRDARDIAEQALEEVRSLSHDMHPGVLDDLGLEAALRKLAREGSHGSSAEIEMEARGERERLPRNIESVFYRVAQEAVRNAVRHAAPAHVHLSLHADSSAATLEIRDDGHGFDLAHADEQREGVGLSSMRERLALVDGTLFIDTGAGQGTTVTATIPLRAATNAALPENA